MRMLLAAVALVACSPGGRGWLEPQAGPGVTLTTTHGQPDDTTRIEGAGVRADVTGRWSNTGPSLEVVYRTGNAAVTIPITTDVRWNGRSLPASAIWDQTVSVPGSVMGRDLLEPGVLRIAARGQRTVVVFYDAPEGAVIPTYGDVLTADIPMPGGSRPATFRAGAE